MGQTRFRQLNEGWNAEPNAPEPRISVERGELRLRFLLNPFEFDLPEEGIGELRFRNCWRYRLGATNDEGWYRGQCRFSRLAPAWGEFYEVTGDLLLNDRLEWITPGSPGASSRHFLFYLRDETFECDAEDWSFSIVDDFF
ncbi:MAG: hypothetical protein WBV82_21690 [Myxococcaceae bacterium]